MCHHKPNGRGRRWILTATATTLLVIIAGWQHAAAATDSFEKCNVLDPEFHDNIDIMRVTSASSSTLLLRTWSCNMSTRPTTARFSLRRR